MKKFFSTNSILTGIVAGLGSELLFCIVLALGLVIAGEPIGEHIRWFGGMFIPMILVLRYYAKRRELLTVTKTLIVVFFVTFLAFMVYILGNNLITFK